MKRHTSRDAAHRAKQRKERFDSKRIGPARSEDVSMERSCLSKTRYPDEATASASALHLLETGKVEQTITFYTYRCTNCRGWHLTKTYAPGQLGIRLREAVEPATESHYGRPNVKIFR